MRVLIADDEPDVRLGLKTIVDWKSLGFDLCGEASNGDECLEKIQKFNPDLVLLDIRMPKMHGLECAKTARKNGWNGKIIILSGYSDFQYAQEAIQCGVESYLLKPIDEEELIKSVKQIAEKIENLHRQSQKMNLCVEKARTQVLLDLLSGKADYREDADFPVRLEEMELGADCYQVVISGETDPRLTAALMRAAGVAKNAETVKYPDKTLYLLKGSQTVKRFGHFLLHPSDGFSMFLAIGKEASTPCGISDSRKDAEAVFNRRFFFERGKLTAQAKDLPDNPKPFLFHDADILDCAEKLFSMLQTGNADGIEEILSGLEQRLTVADTSPEYVADFLLTVYIQVRHRVFESYGQDAVGNEADADTVSRLCCKQHLYEIMDGLREGFRKMSCGIENTTGEHVADRMIRFIETNYEKNLKLETIASSFGYNSAYLGKVFKTKIGESFNSYLDRVRIEKAKELLRDQNLKVYEISKKVGYANIDYFYYKFHKYLSQSPMEYRKNAGTL